VSSSARPLVLVVDDEQDVADTYALHLAADYETRVVYGGEAALEAMDEDVDAVLLDRRMPDLHGDEVLARLRERGYDCPVIMTTAVDPDLNILEMDFDDFLAKPIDRETLRSTLAQHLELATAGDPRLEEFFGIVSKLTVLQERHTQEELVESEEFRRLRDRAEELADELRDSVSDFETIVATYRDIDRGG